jgi:DNA-binding transcriptional ArsR family regulator
VSRAGDSKSVNDAPFSGLVADAERSLLAAAMLDRDGYDRVLRTGLTAEHFNLEGHRLVLRAVAALYERDERPDLVTLAAELEKRGDLGAVGGPAYLTALMESASTFANIEAHAPLVREAAARRRLERLGLDLARRAPDPTESLAALLADLAAAGAALEPRGDGGRFAAASMSASDLLVADIVPPRSLLGDGVFTGGGFGILYGRPGGGKTWLGLMLALAWARGTPWLGLATPPEGLRAGLLELELGAHAVQRRLRALGCGSHPGDERLRLLVRPHLRGPVDLLRPADMADLRQWILRDKLCVVIIDALSRAHSASENRGEEMGPMLAALDALRHETGCGLLPLHHERKPTNGGRDDTDLDALRGHSRLQSDPTLLMRLKVRGGLRSLVFPKVSEGRTPEPIWFRLADDGTPKVVESPEGIADRSRERIVEALRSAPDGLSRGEVVTASALSPATVKRHVAALVEAGSVEATGANRTTRYHLSTGSPAPPAHDNPRAGGDTRVHKELDHFSDLTGSRTGSGTDVAPAHRLTPALPLGERAGEPVKLSPVTPPHGPGGEPELLTIMGDLPGNGAAPETKPPACPICGGPVLVWQGGHRVCTACHRILDAPGAEPEPDHDGAALPLDGGDAALPDESEAAPDPDTAPEFLPEDAAAAVRALRDLLDGEPMHPLRPLGRRT